jgi:excisionase family DNA binding protein
LKEFHGRVFAENAGNCLYTVKEAAAVLKTNADYVHKLRKAGVLKFLKIGSYKVRKETLENFLREFEGFDISDPYKITPLEPDT